MDKIKFEKSNKQFVDEVAVLTVAELDARLAQLAKDRISIQDAQEGDDELTEAKELSRELSKPYNESKKVVKDRSEYIVGLIKERSEG